MTSTSHDEEAGTVTTKTTHFSKYMLVNGRKWAEAWSKEYDYGTEKEEDATVYCTTLLFDLTVPSAFRGTEEIGTDSNITGNGQTAYHATYVPMCIQLGETLIDGIGENDKMAVAFSCKGGGSMVWDFSQNKEILKARLNTSDEWYKDSWTYDDKEIDDFQNGWLIERCIARLLSQETNTENVERRMIIVSGCNKTIPDYVLNFARQKKIKIYTIALGAYAGELSLIQIANHTGGLYYRLPYVDDLEGLLQAFGMAYEHETDMDGDGIPDVVEKVGIRNQFGCVIYTDPNNPDTDGDGLSDGEEIDPSLRHKTIFTGLPINSGANSYYFFMESNPTMMDTDGDSYSDYEEVKTYKTSPRYNDMEIYGLKHDYVSVDRNFSRLYGGYQSWLWRVDPFLSEYGCGLISACDTLLYLAQADSNCITSVTSNITKEENGRYNFESYIDYVVYMEAKYFEVEENGIDGKSIVSGMKKYFKEYDLDLKVKWCYSKKKTLSSNLVICQDDF